MSDLDTVLISFVFLIVGYILGSIPVGILVGRLKGLGDVRDYGSGSTGATNILRTLGIRWALFVGISDLFKGALPVLLAVQLSVPDLAVALTGSGAVIGHIWPVFTSFRGGKGVATAFGVFVALFPPVALLVLFCSFVLLAAFRYVSLMSMVGTITGAGYVALVALQNGLDVGSVVGDPYHDSYILLAGVLFLLIEYKHFPNLMRLISGAEPKVGQGGSLRPQN